MFAFKFDRGKIYLVGNIYHCDSQWKGFLVICVRGTQKSSRGSPPSFVALHKNVHVCMCLCAVSPVASCSHGQVVRLTVCESDTPSSNHTQCSFFFFLCFPLTTSYTCNLLAQTYICTAELATWGVGPDVSLVKFVRYPLKPHSTRMSPENTHKLYVELLNIILYVVQS